MQVIDNESALGSHAGMHRTPASIQHDSCAGRSTRIRERTREAPVEWSCLRSQYSQPGTLANSRVSSSSLTPRCVITNSRWPAAPPAGALPLPLPPARCCSDEPACTELWSFQSQDQDKAAARCAAEMIMTGQGKGKQARV